MLQSEASQVVQFIIFLSIIIMTGITLLLNLCDRLGISHLWVVILICSLAIIPTPWYLKMITSVLQTW